LIETALQANGVILGEDFTLKKKKLLQEKLSIHMPLEASTMVKTLFH
jgi:hypothetical protein